MQDSIEFYRHGSEKSVQFLFFSTLKVLNMKTFIDEAGIFTDPQQSNTHKVSAVGALVIPDCFYVGVCALLTQLKDQWRVKGEIKGSELTENQVRSLVEGLEKHNVLVDAVIVDSKFCTPATIANHK